MHCIFLGFLAHAFAPSRGESIALVDRVGFGRSEGIHLSSIEDLNVTLRALHSSLVLDWDATGRSVRGDAFERKQPSTRPDEAHASQSGATGSFETNSTGFLWLEISAILAEMTLARPLKGSELARVHRWLDSCVVNSSWQAGLSIRGAWFSMANIIAESGQVDIAFPAAMARRCCNSSHIPGARESNHGRFNEVVRFDSLLFGGLPMMELFGFAGYSNNAFSSIWSALNGLSSLVHIIGSNASHVPSLSLAMKVAPLARTLRAQLGATLFNSGASLPTSVSSCGDESPEPLSLGMHRCNGVSCTPSSLVSLGVHTALSMARTSLITGHPGLAEAAAHAAGQMARLAPGGLSSPSTSCLLAASLLESRIASASSSSQLRGAGVWAWATGMPGMLARLHAGRHAGEGSSSVPVPHASSSSECGGATPLWHLLWSSMTAGEAGNWSAAYGAAVEAHARHEQVLGQEHPATLGVLYARACLADAAGNATGSLLLHRTLRSSLRALLGEVHPEPPVACTAGKGRDSGAGISAHVGNSSESHPLYVLSLLASSEALSSRGALDRSVRYLISAVKGADDGLPLGHVVRATAAGILAVTYELAKQARVGRACAAHTHSHPQAHSRLLCLEKAAQAAANASWAGYQIAAQEWAAVQEESRGGNEDFAAFQRARALSAFRMASGPRMSWLQGAVFHALTNASMPWAARLGQGQVMHLGTAVGVSSAAALTRAGAHLDAVRAADSLYHAAVVEAEGGGGEGGRNMHVAAAVSSLARERSLAAWHASLPPSGERESLLAAQRSIATSMEGTQERTSRAVQAAGLEFNPGEAPDLTSWYRRGRASHLHPSKAAALGARNVVQQPEARSWTWGTGGGMEAVGRWLSGIGPGPVSVGGAKEGPGSVPVHSKPGTDKGKVRKGEAAGGSTPSPTPSPTPSSPLPPSRTPTLELTTRLSEHFLRHGMAVYGCKLMDQERGGGKGPVTRPDLHGLPPVKCETHPHPLAPKPLADLYNPSGFEDPGRADMLTARGMVFLQALLADVAAMEAAGQAWELVVVRTPEEADGRAYSGVGLFVPVVVQGPGKGSGTLGGGGADSSSKKVGLSVPSPSAVTSTLSRDLYSTDVMISIARLLSVVTGPLPPIQMNSGSVSNRRELLQYFARAAGHNPSGWTDEKLAIVGHELAASVNAAALAQTRQSQVAPTVTVPESRGPGPWAPHLLNAAR